MRTVIVFALAVLASAGCKKSTNLSANFPAQAVVNSVAKCNSKQPTPLGIVPARHQMAVQVQYDATAVWIGGGPNVCTRPGCVYISCYAIDGGPSDAGYFCDGGYADAGPGCYSLTTHNGYPVCHNDGGYPNNLVCYFTDGGVGGQSYFCDGGYTGPIDAGYCVQHDGGPVVTHYCDAGETGFFGREYCDAGLAHANVTRNYKGTCYSSYRDAGANFCDGGNFCDAGGFFYPRFFDDGGLDSTCYEDVYRKMIDAGCKDAGPGVVGQEIAGGSITPVNLTFSTTYGNAPALWCIKISGAQDGTRDGGWTAISEQQ